MKFFIILFACLQFSLVQLVAQTGPNNPASGTNNTTTGTIAWTTPGNILSSNNTYATVAATGNTNYLFAKSFGFAISGPANIDGIQLEIEKCETAPVGVAILNNWSNGLTKTISAGTNRCLIVVVAIENGNSYRDITSMDYGGQAMTQLLDVTAGTSSGFSDRMEVWMLMENKIALASGTTITPTFAVSTVLENVEFYTSIVFENVDQFNPVYSSQTTTSNASTNPHQLSSVFNTFLNGMSVTGVICGNNKSPADTIGATNTYTINSSFVEGTDVYTANPSFPTSGISMATGTKACVATGTEQPIFTFAGGVNRASMFGFTLQRARGLDNSVFLLNASAITGTDHGISSASWPTTDSYVSYGGASDTWGRTWTEAEINNAGFGAALSASRSNGTILVDHFRITVYSTSTLPIELLEFTAAPSGNEVLTRWVTATETNNDYFVVERTVDGITFESIDTIDGAGNSTQPVAYLLNDKNPLEGVSYYRLKQVDFNGVCSYSLFVAIDLVPATATAVYPNPSADGMFTFLQQDEAVENEVAVFSSALQLVKKVNIVPGEKAIISIADQADGIYFLIYMENGEQKVSKVQKVSREN